MSRLHIFALYTFSPLVVLTFLVFLWHLWLAPYEEVMKKLDHMQETAGDQRAVETRLRINTGKANPSDWKHVGELKLFQAAELCSWISPHIPSEGSNDKSRAVFSELLAALRAGTLEGSNSPKMVNLHTRIRRKDLQKYFKGRNDFPAFLKD